MFLLVLCRLEAASVNTVKFNNAFQYEWCEVVTHVTPCHLAIQPPPFLAPQLPCSNSTNVNDEHKHKPEGFAKKSRIPSNSGWFDLVYA